MRTQSYHVLLECYRGLGPSIKSQITGLRPAQQDMLKQGFLAIDQDRGLDSVPLRIKP